MGNSNSRIRRQAPKLGGVLAVRPTALSRKVPTAGTGAATCGGHGGGKQARGGLDAALLGLSTRCVPLHLTKSDRTNGPAWPGHPNGTSATAGTAVEKPLRGKPKAGFPLRLEIPQRQRDSNFPTTASAGLTSPTPGSNSIPRIRFSFRHFKCVLGDTM
jgi:hypothetical protein